MGSEMQPQIMRAQKSEINEDLTCFQISKHLGLFMFIGSSIADTQHIFLF
jgi:hypothetical protein